MAEALNLRGRFAQIARGLAKGVAALVTFVIALTVGALMSLNLASPRRLAAKALNSILESSFAGTVTVEEVAGLGIFGARGVTIQVRGVDGQRLLYAQGVRVSISPTRIVRSLLFDEGDVRIAVAGASVDYAEVDLDTDDHEDLKLSHAFDSKVAPAPGATSKPGRGVRLSFPRVTVAHAWIHGTLAGAPPIDADVDRLEGDVFVAPNVTQVDVERLTLGTRALPMGADLNGQLTAHATLPASTNVDSVFAGRFFGRIGGIDATATATVAGERLDAMLDAPEVTPAEVHALVTEAAVCEPASAHAEAHGELTALRATGHVGVGRGEVEITADASLAEETTVSARIEASHIDARDFAPNAPHSSLGAIADLEVRKRKDGPLEATFSLDVPMGRVDHQVVPHAVLRGEATLNTDASRGRTGIAGHVAGTIEEDGAPTRVEVEAQPSAAGEQIDFALRSEIQRLDRVLRVPDLGPGSASVEAKGKLLLASPPRIDAALHARLDGVSRGRIGFDHADVHVSARGRLEDPGLTTRIDADGVRVAGYRFAEVRAATEGLLDRQDVMLLAHGAKDFPTLDGRASFETNRGVAVHAASLWVSRGDETVVLRVREAQIAGGEVVVKDAELDGLGPAAHANLRESRNRLVVRADAERLDLRRLGRVLRMENRVKNGELAFDVDVDARRDGAIGHVRLTADHVVIGSFKDLDASVDAKMEGREISGATRVSLKDVAFFDIHSDGVHVGGRGPLDASAWRKAWGKVVLSAQADLAKVAALLPADSLPVSEVSGAFTMEGVLARDSETDDTPEVSLSATTQGLVVGTMSGPVEHRGKIDVISPPKSLAYAVDGRLDVRVDGTSGFAEVAARLVDKRGAIVGIDAKSSEVPYKELFASFYGAGQRLARVPFSATMVLPERDLDGLPPWLRIAGSSGTVLGTITVNGTADEPQLSASLRGHSLHVSGMTSGSHLDADAMLSYDGKKGDVELHVRSPKEEVLAASGQVDVDIAGAVLGRSRMDAWTASAKGKLQRFPLAALGPLSDRQVGGHVSGELAVEGLHENAHAKVALELLDLQVGAAKYKSGSASVSLDERGLDASARLDQVGGFAQLKAKMGMVWGKSLAPAVDSSGTTEVTLQAKHLCAAALLPFLQAQVSELDGNLDADARFVTSGHEKPTMQGHVTFSDGVLQVNALGEEFHAVNAKLSLSPDGVLRLEDASLSGPSGKVLATGNARLDGLSLASAEGTLEIRKGDALPLDVSGASLGRAYGKVAVKAQQSLDGKLMNIGVDVPVMHVELPLTSMSSVQDLGQSKHEHIGFFSAPNRFITIPLDPGEPSKAPKAGQEASSAIDVKVHLGKDVEIRKGTTLKVLLEGDPSVHIAEKTVVRGQIHLKSGSLEVQGKKFEIEKGTVTFVGTDPSNPEVSVTAGWTAEDGTRVYADFIGPLQTGKVALRSEPARPKSEIVELIMFGTADGSQSTPYASPSEDNATRVGTTAGGFATEGLSKGLDQLTGMEITTKIDTSDASNPRPEVEMQIARDISIQLAFVLGTPPPGMNPDTTYASIDWRFVRNWSLETTFGNLGSTIADLIWRYRY